MTPHRDNTFHFRSYQQLPHLHLEPLKGLFELTRCPLRALNSPRAFFLKLQRNNQLTQTLMVRWLKTHFFTQILDFEKSTEYN